MLVGLIAGSLALLLYLGRDTIFSFDELAWLIDTPGLSFRDAIEPYNGHLILTTRLVYAGVFEGPGTDYFVFRLLAAGAVALTSGLFFAYARPRVGSLVALAPTAVLLVFGAGGQHALVGNGFTVLLAISCGLGALIALRRDDRLGNVLACALLCLGVVTYTVALAFVVAAGVLVLWRDDRWRRAWIALIPAAIYAAWWLWSQGVDVGSENNLTLSNLLVVPAWAFQSLSVVLSALSGLDYDFSGGRILDGSGLGAALALIAIAALVWWISRFGGTPAIWAGVAVFLGLATLDAVAADLVSLPDTSRYMYPAAVAVLLVGVEAASGVAWNRVALIVLGALTAISLGANIVLLGDYGKGLRDGAETIRAQLTGIEIAGDRADPAFDPRSVDPDALLSLTWDVNSADRPTTEAYLSATGDYGDVGFSPGELAVEPEGVRATADKFLIGALGLALEPTGSISGGCQEPTAGSTPGSFQIPPGQTIAVESDAAAPAYLQRFAADTRVELGTLQPNQAMALSVPGDDVDQPWQLTVLAQSLRACEI